MQVLEVADGLANGFEFFGCDRACCAQFFEVIVGEFKEVRIRGPESGDVRNKFGVASNSGVRDFKFLVERPEGDGDIFVLVVLAHDGNTFEHGIEGGEALLTIDDEQAGDLLFLVGADMPMVAFDRIGPKEEVANREAAIHGVEEVAHLGIAPDEGTLNFGQANFAHLDILHKFVERVVDGFKECCHKRFFLRYYR